MIGPGREGYRWSVRGQIVGLSVKGCVGMMGTGCPPGCAEAYHNPSPNPNPNPNPNPITLMDVHRFPSRLCCLRLRRSLSNS